MRKPDVPKNIDIKMYGGKMAKWYRLNASALILNS